MTAGEEGILAEAEWEVLDMALRSQEPLTSGVQQSPGIEDFGTDGELGSELPDGVQVPPTLTFAKNDLDPTPDDDDSPEEPGMLEDKWTILSFGDIFNGALPPPPPNPDPGPTVYTFDDLEVIEAASGHPTGYFYLQTFTGDSQSCTVTIECQGRNNWTHVESFSGADWGPEGGEADNRPTAKVHFDRALKVDKKHDSLTVSIYPASPGTGAWYLDMFTWHGIPLVHKPQ